MKSSYNLFKEKRINKISDKVFEVDEYIVTIQIKKGRQLLSCSCSNAAFFAHSQFCSHKKAMLLYPLFEYYDSEIKKCLDLMEYGKIGKKELKIMLEDLRGFKK